MSRRAMIKFFGGTLRSSGGNQTNSSDAKMKYYYSGQMDLRATGEAIIEG